MNWRSSALCDAQQGNSFYNSGPGTPDDNVNAVLNAIIAARTPGSRQHHTGWNTLVEGSAVLGHGNGSLSAH